MTRNLLITIDLGTTRLKVAGFDPSGALLAQLWARHREYRREGESWQEAEEWWRDAARLIRQLLAETGIGDRGVAGLSLSGRGGAAVFLDASGAVIAPPWSDRRHHGELSALIAWRKEGGHLSNYGAALLAKAMWLARTDPDRFARLRHLLYGKDFLLFRLTGRALTDWTSGPDAPDWDASALARAGLSADILPEPRLPWSVAGPLTEEAATTLGLETGLPVAVGGHDGICANVGAGAGEPGAYAITLGTNAVVRAIAREMPQGAYRFYGLPPDRHVIGGNAVMAGRAADWFLDHWLEDTGALRETAFERLDAEAGAVPPGARGVLFLPFLAGQAAPAPRPEVAAAFAGLRLHHGRAEMYRAVLEGGAFALRGIYAQIRGWCGPPRRVRLTGSGARSAVWTRILADVLGTPLELSDEAAEGRGAAIFLAVALGLHADIDRAARAMVPVTVRLDPDPEIAVLYDTAYGRWRALADHHAAWAKGEPVADD